MGCTIVDADQIAKEIMWVDKPAYKQTVKEFGEQILNEDGSINRDRLGEIVFNNERKRKKLNSITHPKIGKEILWKIIVQFFKGKQYVILDIPLLIESKIWIKFVKYVVVVDCDANTQLQRLMNRNNYTTNEANSRINSQMKLSEKKKYATHVIDNNFSLNETKNQVLELNEMFQNTNAVTFYKLFLIIVLISLGCTMKCYY